LRFSGPAPQMEHGGNVICGVSFLSTSDIFSFQPRLYPI
jgi:hypothetical protein